MAQDKRKEKNSTNPLQNALKALSGLLSAGKRHSKSHQTPSPLEPKPKRESKPVQNRLVKGSADITMYDPQKSGVVYQHAILAQTCLPYRDPGDVQSWVHANGKAALVVNALEVYNPDTDERVRPGIPYGAKARLLMTYINQQAIKTQSPEINIGDSMTAFLREVHSYRDEHGTGRTKKTRYLNGPQIREYKKQLARLASSHFTLTFSVEENRTINKHQSFIGEFDLWFDKDKNGRVIWTDTIRLSDEYYESLKQHAVPLDYRAMGNLSHSAMGLDIYEWLAHRLYRVPERKSQFVAWENLKAQFGQGYAEMKTFKRVFRRTLTQVLTQYPEAKGRISEDKNKGYWLHHAQPPVPYTKPKQLQK